MKYNLNDKLRFFPLLLYGLQWLVVSIPSIVILGTVAAGMHETGDVAQTFYIQKIFGITGIALIVQILAGHKLPIVIGPASVLLIGIVATSTFDKDAIYTAISLGGLLIAVMAYTGLFARLQVLFTPRIITVILALIAFTLAPTILKLIFGQTGSPMFHLLIALGLSCAMIFANSRLQGIWKSMVVVFGLILGTVICFFIYGKPAESITPGSVSVCSDLFRFRFSLDAGVILSFLFCFIALSVNELGSIQSVGKLIGADTMELRTKRGVGITGLFNMLSGGLGVIGPIDYSLSPGIISATGCASRYPFLPAGAVMFVLAFFPVLVAYLANIPGVVMGTMLLYLMTTQLSAAMQMMIQGKAIQQFNDGIIICFPLMVAILIAFAPQEVIMQIPAFIRPIVGNGFVMGVISAFFLEHLVFRNRE